MLRESNLIPDSLISSFAATDWDGHHAVARAGDRAMRISVTSDLRSIEDEWRKFEQCAGCTPFQSFDWLATWQACVGDRTGVKPVIVVGRQANGEISFILPLAIERASFQHRLVFLGRGLCDYNAPLLAPEFSLSVRPDAWWQAICDLLHQTPGCRYDVVFLDKMPEVVGSQPNPLCGLKTNPNASHAYLTSLASDWEAFYAAKRSSHARRVDRRKRRRLEEAGDIRLATAETAEEVRETLNELFSQKSRYFANAGVANLFIRPGYTEFFNSVATKAVGLVHVSRLEVGSKCVATNLGLLFRGSYYSVLLGRDDGPLHRHSPGTFHLHELMRYAMARGCSRFDFTIGDERFKRDWADTVLTLHDHIAAVTPLGKVAASFTIARLKMKRAIKQSPLLWALATRVRSMMGSLAQAGTASTGQEEETEDDAK